MSLISVLTLAAATTAAPAAPPANSALTPAEKSASRLIRANGIRADVRFLAHDLLEGRGPGSRGGQLAEAYIAARLEGLGLEPGAPDGSWFQRFDLVSVTTHAPSVLRAQRGGESAEFALHEDFAVESGVQTPVAKVENAEVVFVGYGIVAPEYQWDDYKGADLKGKVILMMNNDPEDDPKLFAGKTRLYYGRWDYKYEMAAKVGAAAAIIIHTTPSAGYPWQVVKTSFAGTRFTLPATGQPQVQATAWMTEDASKRLAKLGGKDLDALRAAAQKRDFKPVPLGVTIGIALQNEVKKTQTANVIGRLKGSDPVLGKQAVLYTAHHDHLGIKAEAKPGEDAIYNGALDNATGVAALLSIAEATKALTPAPRRTVYFAAVAAEEQGLLGSKYLAEHPPVAAGRIAANINMDGLNIWGPTREMTMIGLGKSSLDAIIQSLAALHGRKIVGDQFPDRGYFYRSDQFELAKVGVPAAYLEAGIDSIGKPAGWGKAKHDEYEEKDYHQPSDEIRDSWDLTGAVEDVKLLFYLGARVANAPAMPAWNPGDEFEAARKKAIAAAP
jgi:Zn-dependent M28 family amino/carboxypeptidase